MAHLKRNHHFHNKNWTCILTAIINFLLWQDLKGSLKYRTGTIIYRYRRNYWFIAHGSKICNNFNMYFYLNNSTLLFWDLLKHYKYYCIILSTNHWLDWNQEYQQNHWYAITNNRDHQKTAVIKYTGKSQYATLSLHWMQGKSDHLSYISALLQEHGRPELKVKKLEDL